MFGTPGSVRETGETKETEEPSKSSSSASFVSSVSPVSSSGQLSSSQTILVKITEVLSNPAGNEAYEWIEVGNLGSDPVDIAGWEIYDETSAYIIEGRSAEGYVLVPGEHALFFGYQTGLSLSNDGEILTLVQGGTEVDRLPYGETGEEISFGRTAEGQLAAYCVPTPRDRNERLPTDPEISIQSGRTTDYVKVTLNLEAVVKEKKGTLTKALCLWDFRDGTTSEKCNPPSHSLDGPGVYDITLRVTTYCGEEIERKLQAVVLEKRGKTEQRVQKEQKAALAVTSAPSLSSVPSFVLSSAKISPNMPTFQTSPTSHIDQKSYSTKSSSLSSQNPAEMLPVRYVNIRDPDAYFRDASARSNPVDERMYSLMEANLRRVDPSGGSTQNGFPWLLLFVQSALWLILVGKKWI